MDLKDVAQLSARIAESKLGLATLKNKRESATQIAEGGGELSGEIAELERRKCEMEATAFIDGEAADTKAIDKEIESVKKRAADAIEQARVARASVTLIDARMAELSALINDLEFKRCAEALNAVDVELAERGQRYSAKVNDLLIALGELHAAAVLRDMLAERMGKRSEVSHCVGRSVVDTVLYRWDSLISMSAVQEITDHQEWCRTWKPSYHSLFSELRKTGVSAEGPRIDKSPAQKVEQPIDHADGGVKIYTEFAPGDLRIMATPCMGLVGQLA